MRIFNLPTNRLGSVDLSSISFAQPQKGLSMIELMVAMTLSLILMIGVTQIFVGNKQTFDITYDLGMLQENGRISSSLISDSIRQADHWTGIENSEVDMGAPLLASAPAGCNAAWVFDNDYPIKGFDGASSIGAVANFPTNCLGAIDYEPDTDILVVRYADGRSLYSDAEVADASNNNTFFIRTLIGQSATLFKGSDSATAIAALADGDGVYNFKFASEMYFVRPCSVIISGVCQDEIPTLVRLVLNQNNYEQEVLIEGVEQLQFEYGIDTDEDLNVDDYQTADALGDSTAAWDQVVSVRVNVLTRSLVADGGLDETDKLYQLVGDKDTDSTAYKVTAADKSYRRKLYQREVYIRNRGML